MATGLNMQPFLSGDSAEQLKLLRDQTGVQPFVDKLGENGLYPLRCNGISVLQVNLGKVCNMACKHCHVDAGPDRKESMSLEIVERCLQVLDGANIPVLDITGGAPELNPHLPLLIKEAVKMKRRVMVRTNLTVLEQDQNYHLVEYYAAHGVEVVASLPYYRESNTDRQRGRGAFIASLRVLRRLNSLGYGGEQGGLLLNLVYNPGGAFLPPAQQAIEAEFRRELQSRQGITFNQLLTITNVPVGRFLNFLWHSGNLENYLQRLAAVFNPAAAPRAMCRGMISVGWDGTLYDCDFNQMLGLACRNGQAGHPAHISSFNLEFLQQREVLLDNHCYACTAGSGSSCGGATADSCRTKK
ncbi:MAG: arsenosugar biosynthesis radical SAM (seleno)protein ArsS [Desulfotomaculaceae bacterium]